MKKSIAMEAKDDPKEKVNSYGSQTKINGSQTKINATLKNFSIYCRIVNHYMLQGFNPLLLLECYMFKITRKKFLFIFLSFLWMIVIFCFSARDADESTEDSYKVGLAVGRVVVPGFEKQSRESQLEFAAKVDHPVRKCAHATEFAILGMLYLGVCYNKKKKMKKLVIKPLVWAVIYAATDEFHQLFVPGRSGQISDILLDGAGALSGILLVLALIMLIKKIKLGKEENVG